MAVQAQVSWCVCKRGVQQLLVIGVQHASVEAFLAVVGVI